LCRMCLSCTFRTASNLSSAGRARICSTPARGLVWQSVVFVTELDPLGQLVSNRVTVEDGVIAKPKQTLLNRISGLVLPGEMLAVMGPTGAYPSTPPPRDSTPAAPLPAPPLHPLQPPPRFCRRRQEHPAQRAHSPAGGRHRSRCARG